MHKKKKKERYGEKGFPCLKPCVGEKLKNLFPLQIREKEDDVTLLMMRFMIEINKPKSLKVLWRNPQMTKSFDFSKSMPNKTEPNFFYLLLHILQHFLNNDSIIRSTMPQNKTTLQRSNYVILERQKTIEIEP